MNGSLTSCDTTNDCVIRSEQILVPKGCDLREVGASLERVPNGNDGVVGNPAIRNVPLGILKAQIYGSRLVAWAKRAKAKMMCCSSPGETVLAVNHTAVDRTICFHDSTSGRLLNRVALDMSFQDMPEMAEALLVGGGRGFCAGQGIDAEDGAVVDMCLQVGGATSSDILFAALAGTSTVVAFHARSGTAVATFMSSIARVGRELHANMKTSKSSTSSNIGVPPKLLLLLEENETTLMAVAITKELWSQVERAW